MLGDPPIENPTHAAMNEMQAEIDRLKAELADLRSQLTRANARANGLLREFMKATEAVDRAQFGIGGEGETHWYLIDELRGNTETHLSTG